MGASVSLMEIPHDPELSRQIKTEYEDLVETDMSLDEIEEHLSVKYSSKASAKNMEKEENLQKNIHTVDSVGDITNGNEGSKSTKFNKKLKDTQRIRSSKRNNVPVPVPSTRSSSKKGGGGTRRRSFGEVDPRASEKKDVNFQADTTTCSISMPLDHTATIANPSSLSCSIDDFADSGDVSFAKMDSWSSVVEQPSCPLCQVTFDNEYKLERHIKYSNLHATSLKKEKENQLMTDLKEQLQSNSPAPHEEGVHYRQLYSGDKYFWRTKVNLEIRLYLHLSTQVIEVAGYDKTHNTPTNRVYLGHIILQEVIEDMAMKAVAQRKKEIKNRQEEARKRRKEFNEVIPSEEIMFNEAKRVVLVTHILDRLQTDLSNGKDKPKLLFVPIVKITDTASDTQFQEEEISDQSPATPCESRILLKDPPMEIRPVYVSWRRYSSIDECVAARNDLETGMKDLAAASEKANRLTELTFATTAGLGAIAERYKKMRNMGYSKWRIKWIWATRRIIIQKDVARYTRRLEALGYV